VGVGYRRPPNPPAQAADDIVGDAAAVSSRRGQRRLGDIAELKRRREQDGGRA
jgi:hypothetical protein